MKTIREIAQECAEEFDPEYKDADMDDESVRFFERFIEKYLAQQEPLTYLRFCAGRSYSGHGDIEYNEWLEECLCTDKGDDGQPAVAVFLAPPIPAGMPDDTPPEFVKWLSREMPQGTIIGDHVWWAGRLYKAMLTAAKEK